LIILSLIGIFIGMVSMFFGVGGGMILVPILLFMGYSMKTAISISIVQMFLSSLFGSYINYKEKRLLLNSLTFIGFGGVFGAFFSGYIIEIISLLLLKIIFLFIVIFAFFKMLFYKPKKTFLSSIYNRFYFFLLGAIIGLIAISVGVGGSIMLTPILVGFFHINIKEATASSLFFVVFSSLSGLISLHYFSSIPWTDGLTIGISSFIGVLIANKFVKKASAALQIKLLLTIYFLIIVYLLINIWHI